MRVSRVEVDKPSRRNVSRKINYVFTPPPVVVHTNPTRPRNRSRHISDFVIMDGAFKTSLTIDNDNNFFVQSFGNENDHFFQFDT